MAANRYDQGGLLCESLSPNAPEININMLEPGFFSTRDWLRNPPVKLGTQVADHLAYRVCKKPKDLLSHVQRVLFNYRLGDSGAVYGAMLDLFIILEDKGQSLRTRLFNMVAIGLSEEQRRVLEAGLAKGIRSDDKVPPTPGSRLCAGVTGDGHLVEQGAEKTRQAWHDDVIDEARDLIDSGLIDDAQVLLEGALLDHPQRADISEELLEIYRHTRQKDAFFAMKKRVEGKPLAHSESWDELAEHFLV